VLNVQERKTFAALSQRPRAKRAGVVLGLATGSVGLMAGLLYSFSVAVMVGLRKTDDRTFVSAMQRINVAIQNPLFGLTFAGAIGFSAAAAVMERRLGAKETAKWAGAGLGMYLVAMGITVGVNIPLNDKLAKAGNVDVISNLGSLRRSFEVPWDIANGARSLAATIALGCLVRALILHGRENAEQLHA
jgi:uncharacterized membrane protein